MLAPNFQLICKTNVNDLFIVICVPPLSGSAVFWWVISQNSCYMSHIAPWNVSAFRYAHHKRSEIMPKENAFKIHSWLFVSGFVVVSSWSLVEEVSDSDQ